MDSIAEYVRKNQIVIDLWKNRFNCLFYWDIQYVYDGEHWSQTRYDIASRVARIFPCDIDDEEAWLVHEIILLCFIATENNMELKRELITDITTAVLK